MTNRGKQWTGALGASIVQTIIYLLLDHYAGHWISSLTIIAINIGLAWSYRSRNPYLTGARWASFWNLSLTSIARHSYWYLSMLNSFVRLRDFNRPLAWNQMLCQGTAEDIIITVSTSALLLLFYWATPRWPEWTGRWEMLRRAPLTASLGFQAIISVSVAYPTPLTLTLALFFASIVSPLLRRQVRLNHIVFMMMVPLFSLGSPPLALFWSLVCGLTFLYFVAVERSLTINVGSFAFFNGVAFLALVISLTEDRLSAQGPTVVGVYALFAVATLMGSSYLLLFRGEQANRRLRETFMYLTPERLRKSRWWAMRDLWVDREVSHRVQKLFKFRDQPKNIGYFFFGPKDWAPRSHVYDRVPHPRLNLTPAILVLTIYSLFLAVDAVLFLTNGTLIFTLGGLGIQFIIILLVPVLLLVRQIRDRAYGVLSKMTSGLAIVVLAFYMVSILYFGLTSTDRISNTAENLTARTTPTDITSGVTAADCPCNQPAVALHFPGR